VNTMGFGPYTAFHRSTGSAETRIGRPVAVQKDPAMSCFARGGK
jgi:hypothetical protein